MSQAMLLAWLLLRNEVSLKERTAVGSPVLATALGLMRLNATLSVASVDPEPCGVPLLLPLLLLPLNTMPPPPSCGPCRCPDSVMLVRNSLPPCSRKCSLLDFEVPAALLGGSTMVGWLALPTIQSVLLLATAAELLGQQ